MMDGTFFGTAAALCYMAVFIGGGMWLGGRVFPQEKRYARLWLGGVLGLVTLQWLPVLFSFLFAFTLLSHLCALAVFVIAAGLLAWRAKPQRAEKESLTFLWLALPVFLFFAFTLFTHTLPEQNGALYAGQSTYGDMNMHLGFITSLAVQKTFPPFYSILPYQPLGYPFLCDSVSASLLTLGAGLRVAYMAPMLVAGGLFFGGVYFFLEGWLKDKQKSILAWVLFVLNGGLGFIYFMDSLRGNPENFTRIFSAFYETPTNYIDGNVRWVNIICDMLIPQRATLFGYTALLACLYLLYRAVFENKKTNFLFAGVLGGALPLIHTHSFLALGLISAGWLLIQAGRRTAAGLAPGVYRRFVYYSCLIFLSLGGALTLYFLLNNMGDQAMLAALLAGLCAYLAPLLYALSWQVSQREERKQLLSTWGIYLLVALALALPQLISFTFAQSGGGNFLRLFFNWDNQTRALSQSNTVYADIYPWYYIKAIGVVALFLIPALLGSGRRMRHIAAPALLVWFIAELVAFQPNTYDNNKLLYPAYLLLCGFVGGYLVDIYRRLKDVKGRQVLAAGITFLAVFSALLTMGREAVSSYQLYDESQVQAARYIEAHAPADAVILTNTRHNNAISSLTGRNIVCGAGTFLYFHGLHYQDRERDVEQLYEQPSVALLQKYKVDYVMVSPFERSSYSIDEAFYSSRYPVAYREGNVIFYAVSQRAQANG